MKTFALLFAFLLLTICLLSGCQSAGAIPESVANAMPAGADHAVVSKIKWLFILAGFLSIAAGVGLGYLLFKGGSVVRALGTLTAGLVLGGGCFLIAVYLVAILKGLAIAFGVAAAVGVVTLIMHRRKHAKKPKK